MPSSVGHCLDSYTLRGQSIHMRTNIVIDDDLMDQAVKATGLPSKRAVVEAGLRGLLALHRQASIRGLRGKMRWSGNIDQMRAGRVPKR